MFRELTKSDKTILASVLVMTGFDLICYLYFRKNDKNWLGETSSQVTERRIGALETHIQDLEGRFTDTNHDLAIFAKELTEHVVIEGKHQYPGISPDDWDKGDDGDN